MKPRSVYLAATAIALLWACGRGLGTARWDGLGLALAAGAAAAVWLTICRSSSHDESPTGRRLPFGIVAGGLGGLALAGAAIGSSWILGSDGAGNWALRHGLQLGWWTDQLPFLPGKLLALVLGGILVVLLVLPDELVARGLVLRAAVDLGLTPRSILALQVALALLVSSGDLWLRPSPMTAWAVHLGAAAGLAILATSVTRRWDSLLPAIVLHAAFRCALVVHAFAWIPRLYR